MAASRINNKKVTFNFFNYKWSKVPSWAEATENIYRRWYLERYGYGTMRGLAGFLKNKSRIMEAGCGLARDSKMFAEANPNAKIVAIDQSGEALKVARETLRGLPNCDIFMVDLTKFKYPQKFDFISCDQAIHHTPNVGRTLKHLFNKLNLGGIINFSVCRKKNKLRDWADNLIMAKAADMSPDELWGFSVKVTEFGKALYDLDLKNIKFENKIYEDIQRFVHNNLFRCWYNPNVGFDLSVSSNYDWFSGNPRFNAKEVKQVILSHIKNYKLLRFFEDDATISVSLKKVG